MSIPFAFFTPGPFDMLIIAVIVLLLFGNRLPSVMRSLGQGVVEFEKGIEGVEDDRDSNKKLKKDKEEKTRKKRPARKSSPRYSRQPPLQGIADNQAAARRGKSQGNRCKLPAVHGLDRPMTFVVDERHGV